MLSPLVGQWIQFDVQSKDLDKYMSTRSGYRLSIQEYLPINSPCGVGVVQCGKIVRVMISCILVKSTDHPMLFELQMFGPVIDKKSSLISGAFMQIVLEKTSSRIRRMSGVCWRVIYSLIVSGAENMVENSQSVRIEAISQRDAMETSHIIPIEKPSNSGTITNNTGVTTLKYQQPHQNPHYQEQRRDYYMGNNIQIQTAYNSTQLRKYQPKPKKFSSYTGESLEGHALVEKIMAHAKTGILWFFDNYNSSVHFIFDDFELNVGDYAYVKLIQKKEETAHLQFRWKWISGTKKLSPFNCRIDLFQLFIEEQVSYKSKDMLNRNTYTSKNFPIIFDADGIIKNPIPGAIYCVVILRKKIQVTQTESPTHKYQWIIDSAQSNPFIITEYYNPHNAFNRSFIASKQFSSSAALSTDSKKGSSGSEKSSTSPPLKSLTPPSDE